MLNRFNKHRHCENPEADWGGAVGANPKSGIIWLMLGGLFLLAVAGWLLIAEGKREAMPTRPDAADQVRDGLESAEAVARAFLAEADPAKRLQWVRNAEEVESRLAEYPNEACRAVGVIESVLGHQVDNGRPVTGFVVAFPTGNLRLLEVVGTLDGPKVDWDAYARHGTATWEDLSSGKAKGAVVRVFCEPSSERPEPFADQSKWTCFRLSGPDLAQAALAFAEVGSEREEKMKQVILGTPKYRQRFTLEIVRHEGEDEPLFEITRCLAVGWILERDVEEVWQK